MTPDARRWMAGGVVENDRDEQRTARHRPLPQHREHPLGCLCRERCLMEEYQPGDGS